MLEIPAKLIYCKRHVFSWQRESLTIEFAFEFEFELDFELDFELKKIIVSMITMRRWRRSEYHCCVLGTPLQNEYNEHVKNDEHDNVENEYNEHVKNLSKKCLLKLP